MLRKEVLNSSKKCCSFVLNFLNKKNLNPRTVYKKEHVKNKKNTVGFGNNLIDMRPLKQVTMIFLEMRGNTFIFWLTQTHDHVSSTTLPLLNLWVSFMWTLCSREKTPDRASVSIFFFSYLKLNWWATHNDNLWMLLSEQPGLFGSGSNFVSRFTKEVMTGTS